MTLKENFNKLRKNHKLLKALWELLKVTLALRFPVQYAAVSAWLAKRKKDEK